MNTHEAVAENVQKVLEEADRAIEETRALLRRIEAHTGRRLSKTATGGERPAAE